MVRAMSMGGDQGRPARRGGRAATAVLLTAAFVWAAPSARAQGPRDAPRHKEAPPAAVVLPDPPTPVQQAQAVGLGACAPVLDRMARKTLTSRYEVQSGWSKTDTARHVFQSVAVLNTPGNTPPDGLAALVAAPVPGGCDGVAVQVFPLASDCQTAQKTLLKGGQTLGPLLTARLMLDAHGNRIILLPAYNNTCVAVSVDSHLGTP